LETGDLDNSNESIKWHKMLGIRMAGRAILCIGGGKVAARRIGALLACGARITIVSPELCEKLSAPVQRNEISWVGRKFFPADLDQNPFLVIAATDDSGINAEIARLCALRSLLCNRVDTSEDSTVVFPASGGEPACGISVAILSGGAGPVFSAWLRDRVMYQIEKPGLSLLAGWLAEHRAGKSSSPENLKQVHQAILNSAVVDLLEAGRIDQARDLFDLMISSSPLDR